MINNTTDNHKDALEWWGTLTINAKKEFIQLHFPVLTKEVGFNRAYLMTGISSIETIYKAEHPPLPTTVEMDLYPDNEAGAFDYLDNQVEDKEVDLLKALTKEDLIFVIAEMHDAIQSWDSGWGFDEPTGEALIKIGSRCTSYCALKFNRTIPFEKVIAKLSTNKQG